MGKQTKVRRAVAKATKAPAKAAGKISPKAAGKPIAAATKAVGNVGKSLGSIVGLGGGISAASRGRGFMGKKKSAKLMLKKAYDKRAKLKIRMGMLGQARRDLRKKATVV